MSAPAGFVPVFKGWNVWAVLARNDLSFNPLMVGLSPERRLRIWVEDSADAAPGAAVADPMNPAALKGGQVEIIQSAEGLEPDVERAEQLPGSILNFDPDHSRVFVRFYNRGADAVTPWPRDDDFFLDTAYTPDADSPITGGEAPGSLAGTAGEVADKVGGALKVVAIVAGIGLGVVLITSLLNSSRKVAA
jgi:hypothetical protein